MKSNLDKKGESEFIVVLNETDTDIPVQSNGSNNLD